MSHIMETVIVNSMSYIAFTCMSVLCSHINIVIHMQNG